MKAFTLEKASAKVFAYSEPISMIASFPRLLELVKKSGNDATKGDLFLFINKKREYVKILLWSHGGFCIFAKKLEGAKFDFEAGNATLTLPELTGIVDQVIRHGHKKLRRLKVA